MHEYASVARTVGKTEIDATPDALKAVAKEWQKLRDCKYIDDDGSAKTGCWDEPLKATQEVHKVLSYHKQKKMKDPHSIDAHLGRLFDICVEKG